ncbi:hypothetical protein FDF26_13680 [Clostridium botulinum]|nr:hypothetical protein [Clostridium botulinum]
MKRCTICNEPLYEISYGDYNNPPEDYLECRNRKCGKFKNNYCYYGGIELQIGEWHFSENELYFINNIIPSSKEWEHEIDKAFKEFNLRVKYYHNELYGKK